MKTSLLRFSALAIVLAIFLPPPSAAEEARPNVLFIALDDLNDWVGVLGGHPQTLTPNLDRLAKSGVLFTNAHTAAASCNPSRTAIFTGRSPHRTGVYSNGHKMRQILPDAEIIPKTFIRGGYHASGSGKMLHYFIDANSWNDYYPEAARENPFPRTLYPVNRPVNLPVAGPWQYRETDWGALDATDAEYGGDSLVAEWVGNELKKKHDQPFFLACGIYRPHEPWFVPAKYFKPFPLDSIQLPPGYKEDDIDDLPAAGKRVAKNRYFEHIQAHDQWKQAIQSYLASIHYADAMLGRVLDALENGPNARNTIVVLWSDHGWHLGEKEHWQKYTAWRACTRVPLIIRVPKGAPGLTEGTRPSISDRPVSLLSLFPTLLELTGLPARSENDGPSLVPLLANPSAEWPHVATTFLGDGGSYGLSTDEWRLIHYANGDEELYHIPSDPYEWDNLATRPEHQNKREELRALAPTDWVKTPNLQPSSVSALEKLKLHLTPDGPFPPSRPRGERFGVHVRNQSNIRVHLYWINPEGGQTRYIEIFPGADREIKTRTGASWLVAHSNGQPLGHFQIGENPAEVILPEDLLNRAVGDGE